MRAFKNNWQTADKPNGGQNLQKILPFSLHKDTPGSKVPKKFANFCGLPKGHGCWTALFKIHSLFLKKRSGGKIVTCFLKKEDLKILIGILKIFFVGCPCGLEVAICNFFSLKYGPTGLSPVFDLVFESPSKARTAAPYQKK